MNALKLRRIQHVIVFYINELLKEINLFSFNLVIRGCLSDFPNICANDSQGCSRCKGEGCNKNLSTIIQLNIACLLISLLIVFKNMWRN